MGVKSEMDLIKTIEDDEEVENLSEDSDIEIDVSVSCRNIEFISQHALLFSVSTNKTKTREEGTL